MESGRDSIQDSTTAPTMRMSRLTTAITSHAFPALFFGECVLAPLEDRGKREGSESDLGGKGLWQDARDILRQPAAGDVSEGFHDPGSANRFKDLPDVDAGRCEECSAERFLLAKGAGSKTQARLLHHAAHQGKAIGVNPRGRERENNVADFDVLAREQCAPLDGADCEPCEVVVACA